MANEYIGRRREIAFTKETTRGTVATAQSGDWYPNDGFDFRDQIQKVEDTSAVGAIPSREGAYIVRTFGQGSVPFVLYDSMIDDLATMICGQDGSVVSSVTTWDLDIDSNLHTAYTITTSDPVDGDLAYALGVLNTFTLTANADELVTGTCEFTSKASASATVTPAYTTTALPYNASDVTIKLASNYAGLSGASAVSIKNTQVNIEKGTDFDFALGSTAPQNIYNQATAISGSFTLTNNSTTYRALGLSEDTRAMQITISNGVIKLDFVFPSIDFADWNKASDKDAYITETLNFFVNYKDKTNGFLKIIKTVL